MTKFQTFQFLKWLMVLLGILAGKILSVIPNDMSSVNVLLFYSFFASGVQIAERKDGGASAVTIDVIAFLGAVIVIFLAALSSSVLDILLLVALFTLSLPGMLSLRNK